LNSDEWKRVEKRFKETMPNNKVEKIERIQNKRLWRVYNNELEEVAEKNKETDKAKI